MTLHEASWQEVSHGPGMSTSDTASQGDSQGTVPGGGVQPRGWLVQVHNQRVAHQRDGHAQPALHAAAAQQGSRLARVTLRVQTCCLDTSLSVPRVLLAPWTLKSCNVMCCVLGGGGGAQA